MDELEKARALAYLATIGTSWHGRVPLGGKDPPMPTPPRRTSAQQLESAYREFGSRNYYKAIELAREVEERTSDTAEQAEALRLRAQGHATLGEWTFAIVAGEEALRLEPEGDDELRALISYWRSLHESRKARESSSTFLIR